MKNQSVHNLILLLLFPLIPSIGFAQELQFAVQRQYNQLSHTRSALAAANTLEDLDPMYKSSWVKEFISVELSTIQKGESTITTSSSDVLTQEQKEKILAADVGTQISILLHYIPDNSLSHNEVQEHDFTFVMEPDKQASYEGGTKPLEQYIMEKVIDKVPAGTFDTWDVAAVKFTINEDGEVVAAEIMETFYDNKIDGLLLEAIRTMPCWKPAEYANGQLVAQDFVLAVGNMESCVMNMLNVKRF